MPAKRKTKGEGASAPSPPIKEETLVDPLDTDALKAEAERYKGLARSIPDGPNVDAVKHALSQVGNSITNVVNALDTNRRLAR